MSETEICDLLQEDSEAVYFSDHEELLKGNLLAIK